MQDKPTIAIIAQGAMGAGIGQRLAQGAYILTSLAGRSAASAERARAAGMIDASDDEIAAADLILSIVPPAEAQVLAERLVPALAAAARKPVYIDCNAVNPQSVGRIADTLAPTGCDFIDAGIIGLPPREGQAGPTLYVSGPKAHGAEPLGRLGLKLIIMDGPVGAASALKMSYSGINKGMLALGSAMLLASGRAGVGETLRDVLDTQQPQLLPRYRRHIPDMLPKAHRWVAEMREIAGFLGPDDGAALMLEGAARIFQRYAETSDEATLDAFEVFLAED